MIMKYAAALVAVALFVVFCGAFLVKMKSVALSAVILIGFVMMAVDLVQSLRQKDG